MLSLNFRDIHYILAIAKEKGFSRVSEKYFISQSALSKTVRRIEKELGICIFNRSSVPLSLTYEGTKVIEYLENINLLEKELIDYCNSTCNVEKVDIKVGAPSYFCTYILPPIIEDFKNSYPNITIRLIELNDTDLSKQLKDGSLDIIISVESNLPSDYESFILKKELIILAVPEDYEVNKRLSNMAIHNKKLLELENNDSNIPYVSIKEFENENFLFLRKGNDLYERGMKICRDAGFTPHINMELDQLMTTYYLAVEGYGCTFIRSDIPYYVGIPKNLVLYRINHPDVMRSVNVSYKKHNNMSTTMQNFIEFLKNYDFYL